MNLGALASHEGTTLQSLLDAFAGRRIPGRVSVVVSNNGDSGALVKARQAGVQAVHLSSRTHRDPATLDAAIRDVLVAAAVDVVFLGMSDVCTEIEDLALAVKRALDANALEIEVERPNAIER